MKTILSIFAALAAFLPLLAIFAAVAVFQPPLPPPNLVVDQTEIIVPLASGNQATRLIRVSNFGKTPRRVSVFASDWQQSETGAADAIAPGKQSRSATEWIGINPPQFILQPGTSQQVTVNLAIPASAKLEERDYSTMVVTQSEDIVSEELARGRQIDVRLISRLSTRVFLRQANVALKPTAEIDGM